MTTRGTTIPTTTGRSPRLRTHSSLDGLFAEPTTTTTTMMSPRTSKTSSEQRQQQPYSDFTTRPSSNDDELREPVDSNTMVDVEFDDDDDYDEGRIGQLPSVEEVRARAQFVMQQLSKPNNHQPTTMNKIKWKKVVCIIGLALLILACSVTLAITVRSNRQYETAVASITTVVRVSPITAFDDPTSPQTKALRWMLHRDPLRLPLPTHKDDPFVQRYIVTTFVFALASDDDEEEDIRTKYGMLSSQHECLWNSVWKRADDDHAMEGIKMGILCNHDEYDHDKEGEREIDYGTDDDGSNPSVKAIVMKSAGLHGTMPPEMEALSHLDKLALDDNRIQGSVPVMPYLKYLSLAHNELTGYMPTHFSEMTRLTTLSLSENALQGTIPRNFAAMTDLRILALDGNQLTGGLGSIYPLTKLEEIYLSHNSLEDELSNGSFGKMTRLKVIDMKSNRLSGPLPDILWNMTNLRVVDFNENFLDGHINDVIIPNHPLKYLDVSSNILGGGLPSSLQNFRSLTHLDVSYNRFEILLPDYLANMTNMKTLMLTENGFGPQRIPTWIRRMTDLQHLSFRLTSRTGSIPTWFGELTRLELLDLDWNRLDGTIPTEIGRLTHLKYLMLNRNIMNGRIPSEVSTLPNLKILMLDNNRFNGDVVDACHVSEQLVADCGDPGLGCPDCDSVTQLVSCPCCTSCCYDDVDERCNMLDWSVAVEDEYRGGYDRFGYMFDKVRYVPSSEDAN